MTGRTAEKGRGTGRTGRTGARLSSAVASRVPRFAAGSKSLASLEDEHEHERAPIEIGLKRLQPEAAASIGRPGLGIIGYQKHVLAIGRSNWQLAEI